MFIEELAHGIYASDSVAGTVAHVGYAGSHVLLDEVDESGKQLEAFVKAGLREGQRVLLSALRYNKKRDNFFCRLESSLGCPEHMAEAAPAELLVEPVEACSRAA